jgi:hypothetical protein
VVPPRRAAGDVRQFSSQSAIVEFIPRNDWHVARWSGVAPHASTRASVTAMLRYFDPVSVIPSGSAPRELFVFEEHPTTSRLSET